MKRPWMELLTAVAAALGVALLATASLAGLLSHQLLGAVLMLGAIWAVISRLWMLLRKQVALEFVRAPFAPGHRMHLRQALGRGLFWMAITVTCLLIFPRIGLWGLMVAIAVAGLIRLAAELLPSRRVGRGVTAVMAVAGVLLLADVVRTMAPGDVAEVVIEPPFEGEWLILQGGRSALVSHHVAAYNQRYALDLLRLEDGAVLSDDGATNDAWFSWEAALYAPVAGKVVAAVDGTEDTVGLSLVQDKESAAGNHVVIESGGKYVLMAHLRNGSVAVRPGDTVAVGQVVGRVGNSGNTTSPHLHLQVQTHPELWDPENRSVPFAFSGGERALARNHIVRGRTP